MNRLSQILLQGSAPIERELKAEARAQGHYLTGSLEQSVKADLQELAGDSVVTGQAANYANILNTGFPASSASLKQFPFMVRYWQLRGLGEKNAKRAAAATIRKWMREGMPTVASFRHSKNGHRENLVTRSLAKAMPVANKQVMNNIVNELQKVINRTRSGTF